MLILGHVLSTVVILTAANANAAIPLGHVGRITVTAFTKLVSCHKSNVPRRRAVLAINIIYIFKSLIFTPSGHNVVTDEPAHATN